jgi:hypothetical protein
MNKYQVELLLYDGSTKLVVVKASNQNVAQWVAATEHPLSTPMSVEVLHQMYQYDFTPKGTADFIIWISPIDLYTKWKVYARISECPRERVEAMVMALNRTEIYE